MNLQMLNIEQARTLYEQRMKLDFPPEELKPFAAIERMMQAGFYEPLAFEQDGQTVAYAWQVVLPDHRSALLDYFAVQASLRGSGVGSAALQALRSYYAPRKAALLIECEHPAEAPDPAMARRRIGFYLRAGAHATALETRLFGVRYQIYALPCTEMVPDAELCADLEAAYRTTVPEPYYRGNVMFYGR